MPTNTESGHAKNVATFANLISFLSGYGTAYNPSNKQIQLAALQTQHQTASDNLANINDLLSNWQIAVNDREEAFDPLKKLATRIINSLSASGVSDLVVEDAKTSARKLQGKRATPKPKEDPTKPEGEKDKTISASQMSFDNRIENFDKLISLLATQGDYNPNETDLKLETLNDQLNDLRNKNTRVQDAYTTLSNARITRDQLLYNAETGLVKTAGDIKKYVKSVFGADSPQYRQISKLRFIGRKI